MIPTLPNRALTATAVILLALQALSSPALAQTDNAFERLDPGLEDAAILSLIIPLNLGLHLNPVDPNARQQPPGLDLGARDTLRWEHTDAARAASDILLWTFVAGTLLAPPMVEASLDDSVLHGSLVGLEALAMTSLVTELAKHLTGRLRPDAYAEMETDIARVGVVEPHADYGHRSFFSGHTSLAFSGATMLTVYAYEYNWLDDDLRWIVPASAYTAALSAAYFRVAADRHWLTDVLVGAFVGSATSYLVFALRTD